MHSRIRASHNPVAAFPRIPLNPICGAKKCVGPTVARIKRVYSLHIVMIVSFKHRHQERLCGLPTVYCAFRTDLETLYLPISQVTRTNQSEKTGHGHRDRVLLVTDKGNSLLAASGRVSARAGMECLCARCGQAQSWRVIGHCRDSDRDNEVSIRSAHMNIGLNICLLSYA